MENKKIYIENKSNHRIVMNVPSQNLRIVWERKGAKKPIDFDKLQIAFYDGGVEYLFKEGMLYIEDMEAKIALGLEDEGTTVPTKILNLNDIEKKRLLLIESLDNFKTSANKMSREQLIDLANFAITNECVDMKKCDYLKSKTQIDIIKAIQLNRDAKED